MITTSLQGLDLTTQIIKIVALELEAIRQDTIAVYLSSDIEEQYRTSIFKRLNIQDTIDAEYVDYVPPIILDSAVDDFNRLLILSPESIKEVDDPITTVVYVTRGRFSTEFYQQAMGFIGESAFIFISDDMEWCKENFEGENIFYSPLTNKVEQLSLIARCSNVILADSTFAAIGALMGQTVFSKIVVPADSFIDNIPSSWHRI